MVKAEKKGLLYSTQSHIELANDISLIAYAYHIKVVKILIKICLHCCAIGEGLNYCQIKLFFALLFLRTSEILWRRDMLRTCRISIEALHSRKGFSIPLFLLLLLEQQSVRVFCCPAASY